MKARVFFLSIVMSSACGGSSEESSGGGSAQPPQADLCNVASAPDIEVSSEENDGFPSYAAAECSLSYVDGTGVLVTLDSMLHAPVVIAPAAEKPRRPSRSASVIAWEATAFGVDVVRVLYKGQVKTIGGAFAMAGEPRVHEASVAFTAWTTSDRKGDTDVWVYDANTDTATLVIGGPGQQRFADISDSLVAATDFSEDPDGRYDRKDDLADIVLFDRKSGAHTKRALPGKQSFPMLVSGDLLGYLEWVLVHPEPKLEAYTIKVGSPLGDPRVDRAIADVRHLSSPAPRPAAANGRIWWVANPEGRTTLWKAHVVAQEGPSPIDFHDDSLLLFAPAVAPNVTWVAAARGASGVRRLRFAH